MAALPFDWDVVFRKTDMRGAFTDEEWSFVARQAFTVAGAIHMATKALDGQDPDGSHLWRVVLVRNMNVPPAGR